VYTIAHIGKREQLYGQARSAGGENDEPVRRQGRTTCMARGLHYTVATQSCSLNVCDFNEFKILPAFHLSLGSFRLEMLVDAASEPCADRNVGSLTAHVP
jgi:hypothetical protein